MHGSSPIRTTRSWLARALIPLLIGCSSAMAQATGQAWGDVPARQEIPAAFASAPLVFVEDGTHFTLGTEQLGRGRQIRSTCEQRGRIRVQNADGIDQLTRSGFPLQHDFPVDLAEARVIHPDGSVSGIPNTRIQVTRPTLADKGCRVLFPRSSLAPGDEIEYHIRSVMHFDLRVDAFFLHREHPIVRKEIIFDVEAAFTPAIQTFNGFPAHESDPVGAADRRRTGASFDPIVDRYRWRADTLAAIADDPLMLNYACRPFLRIGRELAELGTQANSAQRHFDKDHPHITIHGRKHENDFTRYVATVRSRHPYRSVTAPVAEVMRFLHNSVLIVPDEDLPQHRSIGEYFHDRRISNEKLISLYRSLFLILEVPFYVGYASDAYTGRHHDGPTDITGATHELLGFREEANGPLHVIHPNNLLGSWLLDEVPMEIAGTSATFFKFREGLMPPSEVFSQDLKAPVAADHGRIERIALKVDSAGRILRTAVHGSLTGYPAIIAERTLRAWPQVPDRSPVEARIASWFQIPEGSSPTANASPDHRTRTLKYTGADRSMPSANSFRLSDILPFPIRDVPEQSGDCDVLLPFPFSVRADILLDARASRSTTFQPPGDTLIENTSGLFRFSTDKLEDDQYLMHAEFIFPRTLLDAEALLQLRDLREQVIALLDRRVFGSR